MGISRNSILIVNLGGTISSEISGDDIVRLKDAKWDKSYFDSLDKRSSCEVISLAGYSSENATVQDYRRSLRGIRDAALKFAPDGLLVLHGTDSMAFFAQLAVRTLSYLNIPTIITGSKIPMSSPASDAPKNLKLAIGFLNAAIEGSSGSKTFGVVYNDSFTGASSFIAATEIMSSDIKGDFKYFSESGDFDYSSDEYKEKADRFFEGERGKNDKLLVIPAVPGFPYSAIRTAEADVILIECYHSGTQNSTGLKTLVKSFTGEGKKVFMAPIPETGNRYESYKILVEAGAVPLEGVPLEGAWAEALLS